MHLEQSTPQTIYRFDGLLGQEDELEDVHEGKLEPPTDDEDTPQPEETEAEKLHDLERKAGIRPEQ